MSLSATATLSLNVSAIKALCQGASGRDGNIIWQSDTVPTTTPGASGDYAFVTSNANYWDLYGPRTTTAWPVTGMRLTTQTYLTSYVQDVVTTQTGSTTGWNHWLGYASTLGRGLLSTLYINLPSSGSALAPFIVDYNTYRVLDLSNTGNLGLSGQLTVNRQPTTNILVDIYGPFKTGTNALVTRGDAYLSGALTNIGHVTLSGDVVFGKPAELVTQADRINLVYEHRSGFIGLGVSYAAVPTLTAYGCVVVDGGVSGLPFTVNNSAVVVQNPYIVSPYTLSFGASGHRVCVNKVSVLNLYHNFTVGGSLSSDSIESVQLCANYINFIDPLTASGKLIQPEFIPINIGYGGSTRVVYLPVYV